MRWCYFIGFFLIIIIILSYKFIIHSAHKSYSLFFFLLSSWVKKGERKNEVTKHWVHTHIFKLPLHKHFYWETKWKCWMQSYVEFGAPTTEKRITFVFLFVRTEEYKEHHFVKKKNRHFFCLEHYSHIYETIFHVFCYFNFNFKWLFSSVIWLLISPTLLQTLLLFLLLLFRLLNTRLI